jgi:hypothetical protein
MDSTTIYKYSTPNSEMLEPPPSSHHILTDGYKLHPTFIAMVQDKPFSGLKNENPYTHLREFEHLCSCLAIAGMTQETIKWKLFPFSLLGKAKQWYAHSVRDVNGDCDELWKNFGLTFFPTSQVNALRIEILIFQQKEKETLGAAWARFTSLKNTGPYLSLPDHILLSHFYHGLTKEVAFHLDLSSRGSFTHMSFSKGEAILQKILENTPYTGIYDEFPKEEKKTSLAPT